MREFLFGVATIAACLGLLTLVGCHNDCRPIITANGAGGGTVRNSCP